MSIRRPFPNVYTPDGWIRAVNVLEWPGSKNGFVCTIPMVQYIVLVSYYDWWLVSDVPTILYFET